LNLLINFVTTTNRANQDLGEVKNARKSPEMTGKLSRGRGL
jgi:hypothetical protein